LNVLIPTERAIYHPVILPNFNNYLLHFTNFLQRFISPAYIAHYKDPKKAYSPKLSVGIDAKD